MFIRSVVGERMADSYIELDKDLELKCSDIPWVLKAWDKACWNKPHTIKYTYADGECHIDPVMAEFANSMGSRYREIWE
jgi:hypothetical protein